MGRAFRSWLVVLASAVALVSVQRDADADAGRLGVSSLSSAPVTIYGAKWCSACRSLEQGLAERKIGFEIVDVDENPAAFARARAAAGASNAIPLTSIARQDRTVWVVGANVDEVERALRD